MRGDPSGGLRINVRANRWERELREYYKHDSDGEAKVAEALKHGQMKRLKERIDANAKQNDYKTWLLMWSFRAMVASLTLNLLTLFALAGAS